MIKTKKLMVLVLTIAIVAVLAGGCVEKDIEKDIKKDIEKDIESYRMTETELPEGVTEERFMIVEPGNPIFPPAPSSVERIMYIRYGSTRRDSIKFSVMECTTKEDAQQVFEKFSRSEFVRGGKWRVDGQFIVTVSWYGPEFKEDALLIFNNAG